MKKKWLSCMLAFLLCFSTITPIGFANSQFDPNYGLDPTARLVWKLSGDKDGVSFSIPGHLHNVEVTIKRIWSQLTPLKTATTIIYNVLDEDGRTDHWKIRLAIKPKKQFKAAQ